MTNVSNLSFKLNDKILLISNIVDVGGESEKHD